MAKASIVTADDEEAAKKALFAGVMADDKHSEIQLSFLRELVPHVARAIAVVREEAASEEPARPEVEATDILHGDRSATRKAYELAVGNADWDSLTEWSKSLYDDLFNAGREHERAAHEATRAELLRCEREKELLIRQSRTASPMPTDEELQRHWAKADINARALFEEMEKSKKLESSLAEARSSAVFLGVVEIELITALDIDPEGETPRVDELARMMAKKLKEERAHVRSLVEGIDDDLEQAEAREAYLGEPCPAHPCKDCERYVCKCDRRPPAEPG